MSDQVTLLFANDAFYVAFAARDMRAMENLWSRRAPVTCIHPGWVTLVGRDAVMESWKAILGGAGAPQISCQNAAAWVLGTTAYVTCYEKIETAFLVATNIFVKEDDRWRLVHHQAGASPPPPEEDTGEDHPPVQ